MTDDRDPVDVLAEDFADRLRRGERPSVSDYASRHPEHAEQIRVVLPAVAQMEQLKNFRKSAPTVTADHLPDRLGDFRIVRELGRGGMGVVFEAVQESLGRRVALKVLAGHSQLDPERRERFIREAKAAARLHHTNIVPVFGVAEHEGLPYYVMQLIPGHGLNVLVNRWKDETRGETAAHARADSTVVGRGRTKKPREPKPAPPPATDGPAFGDWALVATIGAQAARALHYAHQKGVLHRDVKPANLLLDERGEVWVLDFGLAKLANHRGLTETGHIVGTLHYLAPECLHSQADARSDVYGLGATLYELLTLTCPFDAESPAQIMKQIADGDPRPPRTLNPSIPRDLETIVLKAIDRDPRRRYASARELADDLEAFADDRPIRARRESAPERAWRWARQHPAVAALSCCTVAALALATALGWSGYVRTQNALTAEARKRDEAEALSKKLKANLALSLEAFDRVFQAAAAEEGPRGPGVPRGGPMLQRETANRATVLESVLAFYDKFAEENETEAGLRFEAAKAYRRVGEMHAWMNQPEKSAIAFKRSKELLEGVRTRRGDDSDVRYELLVWSLNAPVEAAAAEDRLLEAIKYGEGFDAPPRRWAVGTAYLRAGVVREQSRNAKGAEEAYGIASGLLMPGVDGFGLPPNVQAERMYARGRQALLMFERGEAETAKALLERTVEEVRATNGSQNHHQWDHLGPILRQLADFHQRGGDEATAARLRLEAQRLSEGLGFGRGPNGGGPFPKGPLKKKD